MCQLLGIELVNSSDRLVTRLVESQASSRRIQKRRANRFVNRDLGIGGSARDSFEKDFADFTCHLGDLGEQEVTSFTQRTGAGINENATRSHQFTGQFACGWREGAHCIDMRSFLYAVSDDNWRRTG